MPFKTILSYTFYRFWCHYPLIFYLSKYVMQTYEFFCQILHGRSSSNLHPAKKVTPQKWQAIKERPQSKNRRKMTFCYWTILYLNVLPALAQIRCFFLVCLVLAYIADNSVCLGAALFTGLLLYQKLPILVENCQWIANASILKQITGDMKDM